jgi:hypothetical protein
MERIDETAFNVLLLDDQVEPATAYVASVQENPPAKPTGYFWRDKWIQRGMLIGLALVILWLIS